MNTINITIPRGYAEATEKQVRYIAALQMIGTPTESIRTKCFVRFANIKPIVQNADRYFFSKKGLGVFSMSLEEIAYFTAQLDWIYTRYVGIRPVAKIGKLTPCDMILRDTKFEQYLAAENFYQAYLHTQKVDFLYKLIATLYQPGESYQSKRTDDLTKYVKRKITPADSFIAMMWMMGVKEYFATKFKHLFVAAASSEESEMPDMFEIMTSQIRALTAGDITKETSVLQSPTWSALKELDEKCKPTT